MFLPLQGAATQGDASRSYVRFGVGMLVPMQCAAAECGLRVLMPRQRAAVGVACALWSWPAGVVRAHFEACLVALQAASGCCCQGGLRALELAV